MFVLAELVSLVYGQNQKAANSPFTLTWSEGRCLGCENAAWLGDIRFVSRSEVWGVGIKDALNDLNTVVVHSKDAGRTWREVPQSQQYTDPDGRLAFAFPDVMHGWIDTLDVVAAEGKMISTQDGGRHWTRVSKQFLQSMQFIDDRYGYGTLADKFFRTDDGGRSWTETTIPDTRFIDCMTFLTSDDGWVAGVHGKDFLVFRTVNGGRDWEESRTTPPQLPTLVHDFLSSGNSRSKLLYTTDGGTHWHVQALPRFINECHVFTGDLMCSAEPGFRLLSVHPK